MLNFEIDMVGDLDTRPGSCSGCGTVPGAWQLNLIHRVTYKYRVKKS